MASFSRLPQKFLCAGLNVTQPTDLLPPGKYRYLQNIRLYQPGQIGQRPGAQRLSAQLGGGLGIGSIKVLNDLITNPGLSTLTTFLSSGNTLRAFTPNFALQILNESGYSGSPLSFAVWRPSFSAAPWLYIADSLKMRKARVDGTIFDWGIAPPLVAPTAAIGAVEFRIIEAFEALGSWGHAGTAGAITASATDRLNTTISKIVYDAVSSSGWASVSPSGPTVGTGAILTLAVKVGGTGYVVGDTGTITGGSTLATYQVAAVQMAGAGTGFTPSHRGFRYSG